MTQECIPTLPDDELDINLATMASASVTLPLPVKFALVSLEVGALLEAAEHDKLRIKPFLDHLKPWASADTKAFNMLERSTWKLSALNDLPERQRVEWYMSTLFLNFLVPLVDKGMAAASHLQEVCAAVLSEWDKDSAEVELSDASAANMESALGCWRALDIILSLNLVAMTAEMWDDLDAMKKNSRRASSAVEVALAMSIEDNAWYRERLSLLLDNRAAVERHQAQIAADIAEVKNMQEKFLHDEVDGLCKLLGRLCMYKSDLPDAMTTNLLETALAKFKSIMQSGIAEATTRLESEYHQKLRHLGDEASLCFSLNGEVDELVGRIREAAKKQATTGLQDMATKLLHAVASSDLGAPLAATVTELMTFAGNFPTFHIDDGGLATFNMACRNASAQTAIDINAFEGGKISPQALSAFSGAVASWAPESPETAVMKVWKSIFELMMHIADFKSLGSTRPRCSSPTPRTSPIGST